MLGSGIAICRNRLPRAGFSTGTSSSGATSWASRRACARASSRSSLRPRTRARSCSRPDRAGPVIAPASTFRSTSRSTACGRAGATRSRLADRPAVHDASQSRSSACRAAVCRRGCTTTSRRGDMIDTRTSRPAILSSDARRLAPQSSCCTRRGGSGITPVMAIVRDLAARDASRRCRPRPRGSLRRRSRSSVASSASWRRAEPDSGSSHIAAPCTAGSTPLRSRAWCPISRDREIFVCGPPGSARSRHRGRDRRGCRPFITNVRRRTSRAVSCAAERQCSAGALAIRLVDAASSSTAPDRCSSSSSAPASGPRPRLPHGHLQHVPLHQAERHRRGPR